MTNQSQEAATLSSSNGGRDGRCRLACWTLAIALCGGAIMRCTWIDDMEWKSDERWSFQMSQDVGRTQPWPAVGMETSLGFPNPGLSVWAFVAIGRIIHTPTSMARAVAVLNMIGLFGFAAAVRAYLPSKEREPWLWGLALQAVSPFAIRISRKIWPPSILTPFLLLLWISHQYRLSRWGAFAWGLIGALIGQLHLSGWFAAASLVIGTVIAEYRRRLPRSRYWHWWLLGTIVGLITAIPWARTLAISGISPPARSLLLILTTRVPSQVFGFAATSLSMFPDATLGLGPDTREFERGPVIGGISTHVPDILCTFIFWALVVRVAARLFDAIAAPGLRWTYRAIVRLAGRRRNRDASPPAKPADPAGPGTATSFYLWTNVAIPIVLYIAIIDVYFYHYYYILYPFGFVLVAAFMLPWRRVLLGLVVAEALVSLAFLCYVHQTGGKIDGEFGLTYARQQKLGQPAEFGPIIDGLPPIQSPHH